MINLTTPYLFFAGKLAIHKLLFIKSSIPIATHCLESRHSPLTVAASDSLPTQCIKFSHSLAALCGTKPPQLPINSRLLILQKHSHSRTDLCASKLFPSHSPYKSQSFHHCSMYETHPLPSCSIWKEATPQLFPSYNVLHSRLLAVPCMAAR